ncbi:MAG: transposase [Thermodesulfobacteriota bacterium]
MKTPILTIYKRRLPHWRMDGSCYFVTWRLAPRQFPLRPEERTLVADAIRQFAGERYALLAYVVMDDHVHVLAIPEQGSSLQEIVHGWKSFTAHRLQTDFGRTRRVCQREYFDRIVRDESELEEKVGYISNNPVKRWPNIEEYGWVEYGLPL